MQEKLERPGKNFTSAQDGSGAAPRPAVRRHFVAPPALACAAWAVVLGKARGGFGDMGSMAEPGDLGAAQNASPARIELCRACGSRSLTQVLDLGALPLANALYPSREAALAAEIYPLEVMHCGDCGLAQLSFSPPPSALFDDYPYLSSVSQSFVAHAQALVERLCPALSLGRDSRVIEVASNDGYLLQHYRPFGVPVLGIEPARNVAEIAERERGIPTRVAYFGSDLARSLVAEGLQADVIHANNVMAHVPDINGFAAGLATLLKPQGLAVVEVPYLGALIAQVAFDTVYHEHVFYFSLGALEALLDRHGLRLIDVERLEVHGGSLRLFIAKAGAEVPWDPTGTTRVADLRSEEHDKGTVGPAALQRLAEDVGRIRHDLTHLLGELRDGGARIAAYGAAAKGSTLLNACGLGAEAIDFVVDRNPLKQGLYMAGTGLPVHAAEHLRAEQPDYALLLVWNFAADVMEQQAAFREAGGRFILPVPRPCIA